MTRTYKYRLSPWAKETVAGYCRGYEEMRRTLKRSELDILYAKSGGTEGSRGGGVSDVTAMRGQAVAALWDSPMGQAVLAVDQAMFVVTKDIVDAELRQRVISALILNMGNGRKHPFEYFNITGISRDSFYRRKRRAFYVVAVHLGLTPGEEK